MNNEEISVSTFLNTLKAEVKATKDARKSIASESIQSEQQYHDAVQTAHIVVGARIPTRMSTICTGNTMRSKTVGANKTFGTAITEIQPRAASNTASIENKKEEYHVYFDPEQNIDELMSYKPKQRR